MHTNDQDIGPVLLKEISFPDAGFAAQLCQSTCHPAALEAHIKPDITTVHFKDVSFPNVGSAKSAVVQEASCLLTTACGCARSSKDKASTSAAKLPFLLLSPVGFFCGYSLSKEWLTTLGTATHIVHMQIINTL